jgi:hypothetical protein
VQTYYKRLELPQLRAKYGTFLRFPKQIAGSAGERRSGYSGALIEQDGPDFLGNRQIREHRRLFQL